MPLMTTQVTTSYDERFDRPSDRGREAVLAGTHHRDGPLVEGGRWGISVGCDPTHPRRWPWRPWPVRPWRLLAAVTDRLGRRQPCTSPC